MSIEFFDNIFHVSDDEEKEYSKYIEENKSEGDDYTFWMGWEKRKEELKIKRLKEILK